MCRRVEPTDIGTSVTQWQAMPPRLARRPVIGYRVHLAVRERGAVSDTEMSVMGLAAGSPISADSHVTEPPDLWVSRIGNASNLYGIA